MKIYRCEVCGFESDNPRIFANHIRWAHRENYTEAGKKSITKLKVEHIEKELICAHCGKVFKRTLTESQWKRRNGKKEYCCRACANSHQVTDEQKKRVSQSLKNRHTTSLKKVHTAICPMCGKKFSVIGRKMTKFCSDSCFRKSRQSTDKTSLSVYRRRAAFAFSLSKYPAEFDFELIKKYGWYKAKNHGNNPNGVDRDHMVSVKYGFEHKIDPAIIAHPANCQLLRHIDNVAKLSDCSITYEELLQRIAEWDKKYK